MMKDRSMKGSERNIIRFIYIFSYLIVSILFLAILYGPIIRSIFDHDLLWFIPTVTREIENASIIKLISYLFRQTYLLVDSITPKLYTIFVLSLFGLSARNFIIVSIIIHFCCSGLLYLATKNLGLNPRVSFLSSLMYLTLFAHFHAYMWPMSFQHLIVVFFILLGLNFYLKTDSLIDGGKNFLTFFILTLLVNLIASFCRISILILPVMIVTHILFCSKDNKERVKKYDIWIPLFVIYLIYPLITLAVGEMRIKALTRPLMSSITNNAIFYTFIYRFSTPLKFSILFLLGLLFIFVFRIILVSYDRYLSRIFLKRAAISLVIIGTIFLVKSGGVKRFLIPYNLMAPFVGILASYLQPLENALLIDPAYPYYFIPLQLSVFNFLVSFFVLILFIKKLVIKHRALIILPAMYLCSMMYLYLWNPLTSRYFIYFSPIFCIIFCAAVDYLYSYLTRLVKFKKTFKVLILVLIFTSLAIVNLLAIKLTLFRGKMANTFSTYDYIRTAHLIKEDFSAIGKKKIYINNIIPATYPDLIYYPYSGHSYDSAYFTFMQIFDDASIDIEINKFPSADMDYLVYSLDGDRINNRDGLDIDPFSMLFDKALEEMKKGRYKEATDLFGDALDKRPYLFSYILQDLELEDVEWITGGDDMRRWIYKIRDFYSINSDNRELGKIKYISDIINNEMDKYIQCLFYLSFLKHSFGYYEESKYWFSKIRFLEKDYQRLYGWLTQIPLIKSDKRIPSFLDSLDGSSLYVGSDNYRERYKFERFLIRLAFKK